MRSVIVTALGAPTPTPALEWRETATRARRARGQIVAIRAPRSANADPRVLVAEACRDLRRLGEDLCGQATVEVVIARGELVSEVARVATDDRADLIVIGDDLWPDERLVPAVGRLVGAAGCRVLVVRACAPTGVVVGGIDLSAPSPQVVAALADETAARPQGFAYVVRCAEAGGPASRRDPVRRQPWPRHALRGVDLVTEAAAAPELVATATDLGAELLVVGAGHAHDSDPGNLGAIASHAVERAPCSVLVVPSIPTLGSWSRRRTVRPEA